MPMNPEAFARYTADVTAASQEAHDRHRDLVEQRGKDVTYTDLLRIGTVEAMKHTAALDALRSA